MDTMNPNKRAKILEECENLMDLNDDCLLSILCLFEFAELLELRGICCRFDDLIFESCKRFENLNFKDFPDILKEKFMDILQFLGPAVKSLNMEDFDKSYPSMSPSLILDWIETHCVNLESFTNQCVDLHEVRAMQKFSPLANRLKSLTLIGELCDDGLSDCFENNSLEEMKVFDNSKITENFFKHFSNLKTLRVSHCNNMTTSSFIEILKSNHNLKTLKVYIFEPTVEGNHELVNYITNNVHEIENLEYYSLFHNSNHLAELPNLKKLKLGQRSSLNRTEAIMSDEIEKLLEKLIQKNIIEELSFLGIEGQINIDLLCKLTSLKLFHLNGGQTLSSDELKKLHNLTNLESLTFWEVEILAIDSMIRSLRKLEYLDAGCNDIDVDYLERLIQLLKNSKRPKLTFKVGHLSVGEQLEKLKKLLKDNKNIIEFHYLFSDMNTFTEVVA